MTSWRVIFVVGLVAGFVVLAIGTYTDLFWLRMVGILIQGIGVAAAAAVWWPQRHDLDSH